MYKLMIVDDEFKTRQTLSRYIPWQDMGIENVEQAEDGNQALRLSEVFAPDIVLTDVRMPRMNGIELAKELRTRLPRCKVIFLSAYCDVEYLKNAIKLQAFDYIEKPIDLEEVGRIVRSAVSLCEEDRRQREQEKPPQAVAMLPGDHGKSGTVASRIVHIIQEQAGNHNLTINSIAGQLFLTPSYICLLFKNETGLTVNQYLTSVRMDMAKKLIHKHKIHEVARQVGYTDSKYFTKIFKKEVGWTPSEYRERLRS